MTLRRPDVSQVRASTGGVTVLSQVIISLSRSGAQRCDKNRNCRRSLSLTIWIHVLLSRGHSQRKGKSFISLAVLVLSNTYCAFHELRPVFCSCTGADQFQLLASNTLRSYFVPATSET